jgi:hypothetical protein
MVDENTAGLFAVTELEGKLRGPDGKALRDALIVGFDNITNDLSAYIASGPAPADYAGAETMLKAIAAAREVVINMPSGI